MKIGVYVGSFNPVHSGHMRLVKGLLEKKIVDSVHIVPTEGYWEKRDLLPRKERIKMLKFYETDSIHIEEGTVYPYTYQILRKLQKQYPKEELYLLMGADQLPNLSKWQCLEELFRYPIIVFRRNQMEIEDYIKTLPDATFLVVDFDEIDISSTEIRKALQTGKNPGILKEYLHQGVLSYIKENHYYENGRCMMLEDIVKKMKQKKKTISTMESCTGGGLANAITNVPGASEVFHFGAVTYSNGYKMKMGVPSEVIDTYTVYSKETATAMARAIQAFTGSDYGIGITGKLSDMDPNNPVGEDDQVFITIYEKETDREDPLILKVSQSTREENKEYLIKKIAEELQKMI